MVKWLNLAGPVVGNSVYVDKNLVARDVEFTLPEIASNTAEYNIGGTLELPVTGQSDNMECSITKIGFDKGLGKLLKQERLTIEIKFVQDETNEQGIVRQVGCTAYLTLIPKSVPGLEVAMGERSENEIEYTALKYRLVVDGTEVLNIDKLARKFVVDGKDYAQSINSLL